MKKIFNILIIFSLLIFAGCKNTSQKTSELSVSPTPSPTPEELISTYQVPILMYHYIRDYDDPEDEIGTKLSVSPKEFDEQLEWLKDNGYQTTNPNNLVTRSFDSAQDQNHKFVILTFDDGYRDAYTEAFPILKKHNMTATFYLITDFIDKGNPRYVSWDMVKEMQSAGMNIGSHTITHTDLSKSYDERLGREIKDSKKNIQDKIGVPISDFCYPFGKYDERAAELLKKDGYKTAVTVHAGTADQNSNIFELPRVRVYNNTNLEASLK